MPCTRPSAAEWEDGMPLVHIHSFRRNASLGFDKTPAAKFTVAIFRWKRPHTHTHTLCFFGWRGGGWEYFCFWKWFPFAAGKKIFWTKTFVFFSCLGVELQHFQRFTGQIKIFHPPRFPWNKEISLPQLPWEESLVVWGRYNLTRMISLVKSFSEP